MCTKIRWFVREKFHRKFGIMTMNCSNCTISPKSTVFVSMSVVYVYEFLLRVAKYWVSYNHKICAVHGIWLSWATAYRSISIRNMLMKWNNKNVQCFTLRKTPPYKQFVSRTMTIGAFVQQFYWTYIIAMNIIFAEKKIKGTAQCCNTHGK